MACQLSLQIECPLCLDDFTDPVILPCEHSFCRQCITGHIRTSLNQSYCPQCRTPYTFTDLQPSRMLRSLTNAVREHLTLDKDQAGASLAPMPKDQRDPMMCPEHDEKLKLFCVTEQKPVCVVCRDGQKHQGHQFKPVKEAIGACKGVLKGAVGFISRENNDMESMTQQQAAEITKTEEKSKRLSEQISAQFKEMHQFLEKKESEIKKHLKAAENEAVGTMWMNLHAINEKMMDGKETESIFKSALDIKEPTCYLQWWYEKGFPITEGMKEKGKEGKETEYKSRLKGLKVIPHSLFIGPFETHLQFFVWKEMLGTIKPVAENLTIQSSTDSYLKVSPSGTNVRQADRQSNCFKSYNPGVVSTETFKTGQHYWEVDVGKKLDWCIGAKAKTKNTSNKMDGIHLQLREGKGYTINLDGQETSVKVKGNPSKIGLYLDCERKEVSFYNADNMSPIFQSGFTSDLPWSVSLYPGIYMDGKNIDPLIMCSYGS